MIRWLVVAATLGLVLFGIWGVRNYQPSQHFFDEVSAYEVSPDRPLRVRIPGGVEEAVLASWAIVPPSDVFDARASVRYGLDMTLESRREK